MGLKKIGRALAGIAPIAASAVSGGLLGPVAAGVAGQVSKALGLKDGSSEEDVEAAIAKADPTQIAKLREIDANLKRDLAELAYKHEELGLKELQTHQRDRDSARKREAAVRDKTPRILAFLITGALMSVILILMLKGANIEDGIAHVLSVLVGYLGAGVQTMLSYYFGSSAGSKVKTDQLGTVLNGRRKS